MAHDAWRVQLEPILCWISTKDIALIYTQTRTREVLIPSKSMAEQTGVGHLCCYAEIGGFISGIADVVGRSQPFVLVDVSAEAISCSRIRESQVHTIQAAVEDTWWWADIIHYHPFGMPASPPCPPWSGLGSRHGQLDPRSASWPYSLLLVA